MNEYHHEQEIKDAVIPLLVLKQQIDDACWLKPTAVMLPLSLAPQYDRVFDLPIIRGDRAALIYEPPKARTD